MKIHRLERSQIVPISLDEAWSFFSDPRNLDELTPDDMPFEITGGADEAMFAGQVITYRIRILPGVWKTWVTEITAVDESRYFIDDQRFGPYALWHHLHRFEPVQTADGEAAVKMLDRVTYALPFGIIGELTHALFVRRKLESIFDFRRQAMERHFGAVPD
jgi:ligand-binding SRPBCC domain-containing protein